MYTQTHKRTHIDNDAHTKRTHKEEGAQQHDAMLLPHSRVVLGLQVPFKLAQRDQSRPKDCEPAIFCNGELASSSRTGNSNAIEPKIKKYIENVKSVTLTDAKRSTNTNI